MYTERISTVVRDTEYSTMFVYIVPNFWDGKFPWISNRNNFCKNTFCKRQFKHWQLEKPVAIHFSLPDHSLEDLAIFVIQKIHRDDTHFQRLRESYWIQTLGTLAPSRLNNDP